MIPGVMLLLFTYQVPGMLFVILLIEVYCNYVFMTSVLPLQLLPLTFAAAIAVVVVFPSLPFLFSSHASFLYSARQRPFLELSEGRRLGLLPRLCRRRLCREKRRKCSPTSFIVSNSHVPSRLPASTAHANAFFSTVFQLFAN